MTTATETLLRFIAATQWDDLPPDVVHEAKRALVNFFAVALAGCRDPAIEKSSQVMEPFAGRATATVIGRNERSDAMTAACLNAMSANVFDFDDTHVPTIIHPTAPVAPALFAWSEISPLSGRDFLLALTLGIEFECRLGNALSPWHYQRGWHITSTCGIFGAAVAAGKAMGLDPKRLRWALGTASAQSSGLVETLGTMAKSVGVGNSARNGLLSALLARHNFDGPAEPLEGERAFLRVMGQQADADALVIGLGESWELRSNTYKPYPCGVVLNPVIEACLCLAGDQAISPDDIEQVELVGHPLLRQRTDRPLPANGRESQVSAQHAVAVTLARGRAGLSEFSDAAVAEPSLRSFASKLRFVDDDGLTVDSARVTLRMRMGGERSVLVSNARGSQARPLSDAELEQKLADLIEHGRSGCTAGPLIDAIWSLDRAIDAASLLSLTVGTGARGSATC